MGRTGSPFVFRPDCRLAIENVYTYVATEAQSDTETPTEISLFEEVRAGHTVGTKTLHHRGNEDAEERFDAAGRRSRPGRQGEKIRKQARDVDNCFVF